MTCHREDPETLPTVAEVQGHGLRGWGRGRQSLGGKTGLSDRSCLYSWQPCLPEAKFRCPLMFKQEILVQVIGTMELVEEIKVAPAGRRRHGPGGVGGPRRLEGGLPHHLVFLPFSLLP